MNKNSRSGKILNKSIQAVLSAIELLKTKQQKEENNASKRQ